MNTAKPFDISKQKVWEAYQQVKANKGAAGIDDQTMTEFEENLKNNLYRLWNKLSSGSYFPPPVKSVSIPKKGGGECILCVPTISDRIAQTVAKMYLEPLVEPYFLEDSYGYRPNKSALDAVAKTRQRCWKYDWVLDLDIEGFFDNLDRNLLMRAVRKHTNCKWLLLYIERWLKAPIEKDGQLQAREKGTCQGGVISPLLSNLFLHYAFDTWMKRNYPDNYYERYADDIIAHCTTEEETKRLKNAIEERLNECGLKLHPKKTKIVFCKDANRQSKYPDHQFDFLGFTFRPRLAKSREGKYFVSFSPAISKQSANSIRQKMRDWKLQVQCRKDIEEIANWINPIVQGWNNYYGKFNKTAMYPLYSLLNLKLEKWARGKYKKLKRRIKCARRWLANTAHSQPNLLVHWRLGIRPTAG